jgi:predicted phosphodiesterase
MKSLLTGDWHLNPNPRDAYRHKWQKELRELLSKHGIDYLFMLGDLTDEKDNHGSWLVNELVDDVYELTQIVKAVIFVEGNHDRSFKHNPYFRFLQRLERTFWVHTPTPLVDLGVKELGDVLLLPHTGNYKKDWKDVDLKEWSCIFTHNTFKGAISESGEELRGIPLEVLPPHVPVFSGDVHVPQVLGPKKNLVYVGAPYTQKFGDTYQPRVIVLDSGRTPWYAINCTGPRKRLVQFSIKDMGDTQIDCEPGDILKVRVELGTGDYAQWSEIRALVYEWAAAEGYVIDTVSPTSQVRKVSVRRSVAAAKTDKELVGVYAKGQQLDDRTVQTGLELL